MHRTQVFSPKNHDISCDWRVQLCVVQLCQIAHFKLSHSRVDTWTIPEPTPQIPLLLGAYIMAMLKIPKP